MQLLTEEAGEHLNKELQSKIHTARFTEAQQIVQDLMDEVDEKGQKFLGEPWMAHIRSLERRVEALEKQLAAKKVVPKSK